MSGTTTDFGFSVSVIIPAYTMKRWNLLEAAVASVRSQTVPPGEIIICIDHNDELLERCRAEFDTDTATAAGTGADATTNAGSPGPVVRSLANRYGHSHDALDAHERVHGSKRRFGAGFARNTAAEVATGDVLAFLDDDAAADPRWLEILLPSFGDPNVAAVGGAPVPAFETSRPRWFPFEFDWVFGCHYRGLPTVAGPARHLIGANMAVRADALRKIGGFHSIDFDDLDMCHRLAALDSGGELIYVPAAEVHHFVGSDRVTWRYFWRRCFYVNRHKVRAFAEMESAANLDAEISFVLRSLTSGVGIELRNATKGDGGAPQRIGVMVIGVALAGLGNIAGRWDLWRESFSLPLRMKRKRGLA